MVVEWNYNARKINLLSSIARSVPGPEKKGFLLSQTPPQGFVPGGDPKASQRSSTTHLCTPGPKVQTLAQTVKLRRLQICLSGNDDGALDGKLCDQLKYTHASLPKD